jgi:PPIC-type PPIASE domain
MSSVFPTPYADEVKSATRRTNFPNWLREPLLHFVVLGGLLFAIDHFVAGRADDPRAILVDARVDSHARQVFKDARGREPNEEELYALRRVWLDNEVLYREGLALQVDKGDQAIRDRVIFKALSVVDAGLKLPPVDAKVLRDWFERNRAKYDEPARYDFEEAVLPGDTAEAALRDFATALNAGAPGEGKAGLRVFKARPLANLMQSYGAEFVKMLDASPPGEWRVLASHDGLHVMRLQSITSPKPAVFENLSGVVLQDWTDTVMAEQRTAAVRALAKKYTVKVEAATK